MTIYSVVDVLEENITILLAITKMNTLYILINMMEFIRKYILKTSFFKVEVEKVDLDVIFPFTKKRMQK